MDRKTPGIIARIGIVVLVVGGLLLWSQRTGPRSAPVSSASPTLKINLPTVQYPTVPASAPDFRVSIQSVGNSGITGTATFKDIGGVVAILLHIDGVSTDEENESLMPAELHSGTCETLGPLAYPMSAPDAGESETDLTINLQQFNTQKPMAVVLYKSPQDHTVIACGDVS
jgi:hypothetical protein